ncbi:conserved hypothetical protein [Gluconacetobacter diazotrophicus PA1 5]|uniref:Transmembrane protein n=2 Tax=Gluconacetobacter diazotrophicus TaxID=33996 RepID=A0A7W4I6U6_GLUDI|nr:hypothetical protein [Gluconacetobacter diazotrophicus]ACI49996.1 conserved hypothetical protein [Gluconacetobacter diazotrophicus PA1 5]MBB2157322.1 hypothetical protein [Gluconacetobacter diazotrophicus]TWB00695.1 hypothetical protein FBZ86_1344 [Gluconacetobacter diazotrophicus]CAP55917.1 putative membrane protein [Gluconacetobacter diazotrophicus PA1 5]
MVPVNPWSTPDRSIAAFLDVPAKAFAQGMDRIGMPVLADNPDMKRDPASVRYRWRPALILLLTIVNLTWLSISPHPSPLLFMYVQIGLSGWLSGLVYKFAQALGPVFEWDERQQALAGAAREKGLMGALLLTYTGLGVLLWQLLAAAQRRVDFLLPRLATEIILLLTATVIVYQCIRLLYLSWADRSLPDPE